jgi:hypothetical protein
LDFYLSFYMSSMQLRLGFNSCCFPKGNFPCYKMTFDFLKVFQPSKHWNLIKCNSQPVSTKYTKCRAQHHFGCFIS